MTHQGVPAAAEIVLTNDTRSDKMEHESVLIEPRRGRTVGRPPRTVEFFRVWTPEMAYVLGYWWTDGCMRIKHNTGAHEIEIASRDREHLEIIAQAIGEKFFLRKVIPHSETYAVAFCSKEMYRDIQTLGGTPRKSRTIGFPDVPLDRLPHFVRGVVDGDGTLSWNGDRPILQVYSGSPRFLNGLIASVERGTGIPAPTPQANHKNWTVKWSTVRAQCLVAWLYFDNPGLALGRKASIAAQFIQWQPRGTPLKGSITDAMRLNFPDYLPS
jgi:hypothetical protein